MIETWKVAKSIDAETARSHPVCEYIVLSEFDITTGSTVRYQYPSDVPGVTPDWLAEHCIPEGIHARENDATYLFINRSGPILEDTLQEEVDDKPKGRKGDHFLYGINVARTKKDDTVKRGAVVKSLAVFSKWSFVESFKWVLSKGLETLFEAKSETVPEDNTFASPALDTLRALHSAFNAMDITGLPLPTVLERQLMHRNVARVGEMVQVLSQQQQQHKQQQQQQQQHREGAPASAASSSPPLPPSAAAAAAAAAAMTTMQYCQPSHWVQRLSYRDPHRDGEGMDMDVSVCPHLGPDEVGDLNVTRLLRALKEHTMTVYVLT
jgi:hypothetical protein